MSRHHRKNLKRGDKQPLEQREQRVRNARHGQPHTMRRWSRSEEMVAPGTPGAKRTAEERDPKVIYPAGTIEVDGLVVVYRKTVDRSRQVPVTEPFKRLVAAGPTGTVGEKNTGGAKAGKKMVKPKAL